MAWGKGICLFVSPLLSPSQNARGRRGRRYFGSLNLCTLVDFDLPYVEGHLVRRDIVLETGRQFILGTIDEHTAKKGSAQGGENVSTSGNNC